MNSFYSSCFMSKNSPILRVSDQLEQASLSAWSTQADFGICAVDDSLRVVILNPAARKMLGVDGFAVLNQPFSNLVVAIKFKPGVAQWLPSGKPSATRPTATPNYAISARTAHYLSTSCLSLPSRTTRARLHILWVFSILKRRKSRPSNPDGQLPLNFR